MERQIKIRSDFNSLKALQKVTKKNYLNAQFQANKKWAKNFLFTIGLGIVSYLLTNVSLDFIVLTLLSVLGGLGCFIVMSTIIIKQFFVIRKYNIEFEKFTEKYANTPIVTYHLKEDTLDYKGESEVTYKWSEFLSVRDDEDSFWLSTGKIERDIWIPKLVIVNPEDYDTFKAFAENKINHAVEAPI